jgi:LacI family transcriptional regulator
MPLRPLFCLVSCRCISLVRSSGCCGSLCPGRVGLRSPLADRLYRSLMPKRVTIKDIAQALNTNSSTVSRALNDSPLISDQTKALVRAKATELGYYPNSIARQLREGKSRTIGLLVPLINRVFFANIIHGVESVARARGYQLLICQSNDDVEEEIAAIRTLRAQKVAGMLVSRASAPIDERIYQEALNDGLPLVMFDRILTTLNVNKVVNANQEASYQAVQHLIEQGYRRIAHFGGPLTLSIYQERYAGYQQALQEAGIAEDPALVFHPVITQEAGRVATQRMLAEGLAFDAIAATSDLSALGAWRVMREQGIDIGPEKGLIGFANETFTELIGISSVEQYSVEMGKTAARLLFEDIEEEAQDAPQIRRQVLITPQLVLRSSSQRR